MDTKKIMTPAEWRISKDYNGLSAREVRMMEEYAAYVLSESTKPSEGVEEKIHKKAVDEANERYGERSVNTHIPVIKERMKERRFAIDKYTEMAKFGYTLGKSVDSKSDAVEFANFLCKNLWVGVNADDKMIEPHGTIKSTAQLYDIFKSHKTKTD